MPKGFFTTRFVAARTRREAEALGCRKVLADWRGWSLWSLYTGVAEPLLRVEESAEIPDRFRLRSATGYAFYEDNP